MKRREFLIKAGAASLLPLLPLLPEPDLAAEYADDGVPWYTDEMYPRVTSGNGIIIVQTKWHEDDLLSRMRPY